MVLLFLVLVELTACSPVSNLASSTINVEWTTASETNTAGFNLYRSERAGGSYIKVNAQLIPASTDPLTGGKYSFEDKNVTPGKTYYYELEDVQLDGVTTRHGPIVVTAPGATGEISGLAVAGAVSLAAFVVVAAGLLFVRGRRKMT